MRPLSITESKFYMGISLNNNFKKPLSYYAWVGVFLVMVTSVILGLYYATKQIDYIWRWNKIPGYFYYQENVKIKSTLEGEVESVEKKAESTIIKVRQGDEVKSYQAPQESEILVEEWDFVEYGDPLASYKEWRTGILMEGMWLTIKVSVAATIFGIMLGLFIGLARISENPALKWSAITYIEIIRGSPLLVQIFIWYFVLGTLFNTLLENNGLPIIPPLWFGVASLATFTGAYVAEIVRAGIQSINRGQIEAARSLGMPYSKAMIHVILPQAFKRILPPLAGQFITLIKDSSLLGLIAIRELTKATREIVSSSLQPFELWFICAILYLVLTFSLSMLLQYAERKLIK